MNLKTLLKEKEKEYLESLRIPELESFIKAGFKEKFPFYYLDTGSLKLSSVRIEVTSESLILRYS